MQLTKYFVLVVNIVTAIILIQRKKDGVLFNDTEKYTINMIRNYFVIIQKTIPKKSIFHIRHIGHVFPILDLYNHCISQFVENSLTLFVSQYNSQNHIEGK